MLPSPTRLQTAAKHSATRPGARGRHRRPSIVRAFTLGLVLFAPLPAAADAPRPSPCAAGPTDLGALATPANVGQRVDVVADVSGVFQDRDALGGFFVQTGDGLAARGLFVFAPRSDVDVGTRVAFSATLERHGGRIQLQRPSRLTVCGPAALTPLELVPDDEDGDGYRVRAAGGRETIALADAPLDVLVRIDSAVVTDVHDLGRYGSLRVAPERRFAATQRVAPQGARPQPATPAGLVIDDGSYRADPDPIPHLDPATGTRRVGDRLAPITGVLTDAFDERRVHPTAPLATLDANPRPGRLARQPDTLRVAAFNLENLFVTQGSRGAADDSEAARQLAKLRAAIDWLDADILGLIELENRAGVGARLIEALNAGRPQHAHYALVPHPAPGTDAIQVGLAYRPAVVELIDARALSDRAHLRTPLTARFRPAGAAEPLDVTVVHHRSRSRCPERGDVDRGAGCWNEQRTRQTDAVVAAVERRLGTTDHPALIVGDFNAHAFEPPLTRAAERGWRDLRDDPVETRYTYVFHGRSAQLDYTLGNAAAADRRVAAGSLPINADEPPFGTYNGRAPFGGAAAAFRSADHDPVWVDLRLD